MTAISNANLPVSNGAGDAALAHIQSTRVIGSTTIATDTIANWPSFFIATTGTLLSSGFIDPTTKTDFYGHLGTGNQLVIDGFCPGNTDNGNTSTQVVVIKPNTEWANLISQGVQNTSLFPAQFANFVEPAGGVWSISSGLVGVQTVGNVWYQGVRYSIPAVATLTFTASKDTYVDVNPATGVYTYVPVANFAAAPAVTANCVRVAKIVTSASAITDIHQMAYNTPRTMLNSSNPYKFNVYRAAALANVGVSPILFDTKIIDTDNNYNPATGLFTAPIPGDYQFNAMVAMSNPGITGFGVWFTKGGVNYNITATVTTSNVGNSFGYAGSKSFSLNAGDTVSVGSGGSSGAMVVGLGNNSFEGFLISNT